MKHLRQSITFRRVQKSLPSTHTSECDQVRQENRLLRSGPFGLLRFVRYMYSSCLFIIAIEFCIVRIYHNLLILQTFGLFLVWEYYKLCCYEHFLMSYLLHLISVNSKEWNFLITGYACIFSFTRYCQCSKVVLIVT